MRYFHFCEAEAASIEASKFQDYAQNVKEYFSPYSRISSGIPASSMVIKYSHKMPSALSTRLIRKNIKSMDRCCGRLLCFS